MFPRIYVLYYGGDDPRKNTALKMVRMGLAVRVSRARKGCIVLNPYAKKYLGPWDREALERHGVLVVDTSWRKLTLRHFPRKGLHRRLPLLIAGNPINYGKPYTLSSIEAVAAALYITGFKEDALELARVYKWMKTFFELNRELLEEYSKASSEEDLLKTINEVIGETKN